MNDPTLNNLQSVLDSCLWDQLLILADRYEELDSGAGDMTDLAQALRWLSAERLAPLRYGERYHWRNLRDNLDAVPLGHALPSEVVRAMRNLDGAGVVGCNWNERESLSEAYLLAARAIVAAKLEGKGPLAPVVPEPEDEPASPLDGGGYWCDCGTFYPDGDPHEEGRICKLCEADEDEADAWDEDEEADDLQEFDGAEMEDIPEGMDL